MMYGRNYLGDAGCFSYFSTWHYLIIIGVFIAILGLFLMSKKRNNYDNSALNSLKEKFVRGEINEEEYLNKKNILNRK